LLSIAFSIQIRKCAKPLPWLASFHNSNFFLIGELILETVLELNSPTVSLLLNITLDSPFSIIQSAPILHSHRIYDQPPDILYKPGSYAVLRKTHATFKPSKSPGRAAQNELHVWNRHLSALMTFTKLAQNISIVLWPVYVFKLEGSYSIKLICRVNILKPVKWHLKPTFLSVIVAIICHGDCCITQAFLHARCQSLSSLSPCIRFNTISTTGSHRQTDGELAGNK
jgi:hypothetical protein